MYAGVEAFDKAVATQTIRWVGTLTREWVSKLHEPRTTTNKLKNAPGGVLVAEMAAHALEVFRLHRRAVRNNEAYRLRAHDAAPAPGLQLARTPRRLIIIRSLSTLIARKKKNAALRNQARNKKGLAPLPATVRPTVLASTKDSGAVRLHVPAFRLAARAQNRRIGPAPRPVLIMRPAQLPPRPGRPRTLLIVAQVIRRDPLAANPLSSAQTAATGIASNLT